MNESVAINKSLSALGDVFQALSKKQPHVPYKFCHRPPTFSVRRITF